MMHKLSVHSKICWEKRILYSQLTNQLIKIKDKNCHYNPFSDLYFINKTPDIQK